MIKPYSILFMIIGLMTMGQQAHGQLIYFSDSFGEMFTVDISSGGCEVNSLGLIQLNGFELIPTDIAFHPNGRLYATDGINFYEINQTTLAATLIGAHNTPSIDFINALVCDSDGVVYGADTRLFTIDITDGSTTNLGALPCESSGDLAFNDGELYLACQQNRLLKIDLNDPEDSQIVGTMNAANSFFGIVTFATQCTDVQTYGTAGNGLYEITIDNAATSFVCTLDGATEVFGAAMETDFVASNCEIILDLDNDNSTGALGSDFLGDTICGNVETMLVDDDFTALAEGLIVDSMVFDIAVGLEDGAAEQLLLEPFAGGMTIFGSGTSHIRLENTAGIPDADIVHPLENIRYINMAIPYTPGTREITVQIFAKDNLGEIVVSSMAIAFITLDGEVDFFIDLGADMTLCGGELLSLDASYLEAVAYEWQDGTTTPMYEVTSSGVYSVTVTEGCGGTAVDEITANFIPPLEFLDLGADTIICSGETLTLDAILIDGITYEWQDGTTGPIYEVLATGLYEVQAMSGCGIQTDAIFVEFQELPDQPVFPEDSLACPGDIIVLNAAFPNALAYTWQDGSNDSLFVVTESGDYSVQVDFQCGTYTDETSIIYPEGALVVNLGPDTIFCFGDSVILDAFSPLAVNYLWQDGSTEETFVVRATGNYNVTLANACQSASDDVFLRLVSCCDVFVPNVFSPNFDGRNDSFQSFSDCEFPSFDLKIFNRWGALIYQTNDQYAAWDGRFKGQDAQEGVYVWMMQYNDGVEEQLRSGSVTLVK